MDGEQMRKEFFPLVRHNKVEDVENALAAGFPVDTRDEHGNTALMVSCQNGHKRLAKLCLKYGASPDGTNHQGNTALHYAVGYGYQALAKYLISHGADDTIMNMQGQTPYEMTK
jgi:ankyrin repeat protein